MLSLTAQFHQVFPLFLGRVEPIFADLPLGERLFPLPDTIQNPESRLREITVFSIDPVQIVHLLDQLIVQCDLCKRFSPVLFHRSFPPVTTSLHLFVFIRNRTKRHYNPKSDYCQPIKKYAKLTLPIVSFCVSLYNNLGISSGRSAVRPYRQCLGSPY